MHEQGASSRARKGGIHEPLFDDANDALDMRLIHTRKPYVVSNMDHWERDIVVADNFR
jgi:hypothetical protein